MELQGELALVGPSRGVAPSDGSSQDGAGGGQEKEQLSEEGAHGEDAKPEEDTELDSARGLLPVRRFEVVDICLGICFCVEAVVAEPNHVFLHLSTHPKTLLK